MRRRSAQYGVNVCTLANAALLLRALPLTILLTAAPAAVLAGDPAAGQGERAARLLGAASALREALGAPQPAQDKADVEQAVVDARAALGEAAWAAAFAAGQAMMLQEAIAEALAEANAPLTASEPRDVP